MLSLPSLLTTLTSSGRFGATVIARATLPSGVYAVSDRESEFTWNGQQYIGMGAAFQVSVPPGTTVGKQQSASLRLTWDIDSISSILAENYRKAPCTIAVLLRDLSTETFAFEVPCFAGYLNTCQLDRSPAKIEQPGGPTLATATFTVQPRSARLDQVGVRVRSDPDQRTHRDANDGFFKDVGVVAKAQINWGRSGPASPSATLGVSGGISPADIVNGAFKKVFD
jgi:hypothetical protein